MGDRHGDVSIGIEHFRNVTDCTSVFGVEGELVSSAPDLLDVTSEDNAVVCFWVESPVGNNGFTEDFSIYPRFVEFSWREFFADRYRSG